jgi:hypothetical protein
VQDLWCFPIPIRAKASYSYASVIFEGNKKNWAACISASILVVLH